jgi:hypothetical protein
MFVAGGAKSVRFNIGERRLKAQMKPFSELELFGQARVDVDHARALQNAQSTISETASADRG